MKQTLVAMFLVVVSCGTLSARGDDGGQQWRMPWMASNKNTLIVYADPRPKGNFTVHTVRVTDAAGKVLYTEDLNGLWLDATPLEVNPDTFEHLFVIHMTGGGGATTTRVVVLRYDGTAVKKVADMTSDADYLSLVDVDGDGTQEILVTQLHKDTKRPAEQWPLEVVAYRWNGSALVRFAAAPSTRWETAIHQLFGATAHGH